MNDLLVDFQRAARALLETCYPEAKYAMLTVRLADDTPLVQIPVTPEASFAPPPASPLVAKSR